LAEFLAMPVSTKVTAANPPGRKISKSTSRKKRTKLNRPLTKKEKEDGYGVFKLPSNFSMIEEGTILEPYGEHTHTLVYLHHLDSDESVLVGNKWWFNGIKGLRLVFPRAPFHKSDYYEETLRLWFDYQNNHHNDMNTISDTIDRIVDVVKEQCDYLSPDRVFLGGYSQGAVMAFHCLMDPRLPPLGGFVSTSGCIMHQTKLCRNQLHTPIHFDIPALDHIYPSSRTVRQVKNLVDNEFTNVQHILHKKKKHEAWEQRLWVQRFLTDVMSRTRRHLL
jgi:predicted esterase